MEEIINVKTFIDHLTYYLKVTIYINKGINDETFLENCIIFYNKLRDIASSVEISEDDEQFIRRCLKRINLVLKIDSDGNPVDIYNKENQGRIFYLSEHPSISENNLKLMLEHIKKNDLKMLKTLSLRQVLREGKYQKILWQYTRSLFYISQILLSFTDSADPNYKIKKQIYDSSLDKLGDIIEYITELEESIKLDQTLAADIYLKNKLNNIDLSEKKISIARDEVKEMMEKKGLGGNKSILKMVDSIAGKLNTNDLSEGFMIQKIWNIAQSVTQEVQTDLEDPSSLKDGINAITGLFQETIGDQSLNDKIPPQLKNLVQQIGKMSNNTDNIDPEADAKILNDLMNSTGLNQEELYNSIQSNNGQVDFTKLESFVSNMQK